MPTGGVTRENAGDWIRAGAAAIGVGTALVDQHGGRGRPLRRHHRATRAQFIDAVQRRARRAQRWARSDGQDRLLRRNHAAAEPAWLRAAVPVAGAAGQFGGGEANVAVSLAQFGCDSAYVTRLPANPVGDAALRALRAEGVNVEHVVRGGSRLGIYFAETGASQRASTVVYDRGHSAISELQPGSVPWHDVFEGAAGFTGPASRRR